MRSLHLVYGAIDLSYTPDGDYCFLEINPAGQWQFLEEKTDLRITGYFANRVPVTTNPCRTVAPFRG